MRQDMQKRTLNPRGRRQRRRLWNLIKSGAAPLVCCSAMIRQEYQTSESNSGIFRSPPPLAGPRLRRRPTLLAPSRSKFLQLSLPRTHLGRLYLAILAPRCPSRRQFGPKIRIRIPLELILDPSCTQHRPK